MTDRESTGPESMGSYSLDDEDQLQPEDTLDDRGVDDLLDEGYSPPERPRGVDAFGTTLAEQRQGESIEQRLAHEEPDPANAFEDPLAESDMVGGDDEDADPLQRARTATAQRDGPFIITPSRTAWPPTGASVPPAGASGIAGGATPTGARRGA